MTELTEGVQKLATGMAAKEGAIRLEGTRADLQGRKETLQKELDRANRDAQSEDTSLKDL